MRKHKHNPWPPLTYSPLHVMLASPTQPLAEPRRRHQLTCIWQGLAAVERGEAPGKNDWRVLSDTMNLLETLVKQGSAQDASGLIAEGVQALALAGRRQLAGGQIRLDGPGVTAVRGALEDYAQLLALLPERDIIRCHRATEIRLREIRSGQRQAHDVQVVQL